VIEVINLTKKFIDVTAVNNISFNVEKGEIFILLGTSGCGKTTTLKIINRLVEPTSGEIIIEGKNVRNQKPEDLRKRIGYVIQSIGLFPHYTVEQNVATVPNLLKWDEKKTKSRTRELLEIVGLPPDNFLNRKPDELSGGQQQRVGLVRALAADPAIVLLDEPFGALDPITRRQIKTEFVNMENILLKTMILVTHDVFEACELGDKICLMNNGKIKQVGTAKELIFSPQNDFVRNFFRVNRFQLELRVISLSDVLEFIPKSEAKGNIVKEFSNSVSILEVLEEMSDKPNKESLLAIKDKDENIILKTNSEAVMQAFYKKRALLSK
jgi:osmoprotectant transport system ATP-binding protein